MTDKRQRRGASIDFHVPFPKEGKNELEGVECSVFMSVVWNEEDESEGAGRNEVPLEDRYRCAWHYGMIAFV